MTETVIAVLLTRGGSPVLPETLYSLRSQTHKVETMIAVDIGQRSNTGYLEELLSGLNAVHVSTFKDINKGIRAVLKKTTVDDPDPWLWFVPDGTVPASTCLEQQLDLAERSSTATIIGGKQLEQGTSRTIIDVGLTTSKWSNPTTLIDYAETDQGQYDNRKDVLGVNLAGMLIQENTWDQLGGFDSRLSINWFSLDLCWRTRLAGDRVMIAPNAVIYHVDSEEQSETKIAVDKEVASDVAVRRQQRRNSSVLSASDRPKSEEVVFFPPGEQAIHPAMMDSAQARAQRGSEVYLRLKNSSFFAFPFLYIGALIGAFGRLLLGFITKDPSLGWSQFRGTLSVLVHPFMLMKARRATAKQRRINKASVKSLQASNRQIWNYHRDHSPTSQSAVTAGNSEPAEAHGQSVPDQSNSEAIQGVSTKASGLLVTVICATLLSLGWMITFFGGGALGGGATLPVSEGISQTFHNATSLWVTVGEGFSGHGHPFAYILTFLSLISFGHGNIAIIIIMMLAGPLSSISMWFLSGIFTKRAFLRFFASIAWIVVPTFSTAVAQGRIGAVMIQIVLPVTTLALIRATGGSFQRIYGEASVPTKIVNGSNGRTSWTAAALGGIGLLVITAASPMLLPIVVLVVLAASIFLGKNGSSLWWAVLPSLVVYFPYIIGAITFSRAILGDPGVPSRVNNAPLWQQLLGVSDSFEPHEQILGLDFLEGSSIIPWALVIALLIFVPVILFALFSFGLLGSKRRSGFVKLLWIIIALFLINNLFFSRFITAVDNKQFVTPWIGPGVSMVALVLICLGIMGADFVGYKQNMREYESKAHKKSFSVTAVLLSVTLIAGTIAVILGQTAAPSQALQNSSQSTDDKNNSASLPTSDVIERNETDKFGTIRWVRHVESVQIPTSAVELGQSALKTKTLIINTGNDQFVSASLVRNGGNTLDQTNPIVTVQTLRGSLSEVSTNSYDTVESDVRSIVASVVAGNGDSVGRQMRSAGIGSVIVRDETDHSASVAETVDRAGSLESVGKTSFGWFWRLKGSVTAPQITPENVSDAVADIRILDKENNVIGFIPSNGRGADIEVNLPEKAAYIVMSQRASDVWTAKFKGNNLTPTSQDQYQQFEVNDSGSGKLEIKADRWWIIPVDVLIIIILGLTLFLAIPTKTRVKKSSISQTGTT